MEEFFAQFWDILLTLIDPRNLTHPEEFKNALNQPGVFWAALAVVNFIVFAETGLLFGFLFPGDSLLVVLGVVANLSGWNIGVFITSLTISAILGEMSGYWIGKKLGPSLFNRPDGRFFKQKYVTEAHEFFERHGGKALIIARFMPFVRTFVPVIAGVVKMSYRHFMLYNVVGGVLWIASMLLFGYYGLDISDGLVRRATGNPDFTFAKHLDKIVFVIVLLSVAPMLLKAWKKWRATRALKSSGIPIKTS